MKAELNESNPGALKKVYKDYLDSTANKGTWMSPILQSEIKDSIRIISQSKEITILKSESTGMIVNPLLIQNHVPNLREVEFDNQVSKVVWTHPLKIISSSEIPNGDKSAKVARRAKL